MNTAGATTLLPFGEVYVCPGERQVFSCRVEFDTTAPNRLMWNIHFQNSVTEPDIFAVFIPSDPVGHIQINRDIFVFNLTTNDFSGLESTMTVNAIMPDTLTNLNGARVSCSQQNRSHQYAVINVLNGNSIIFHSLSLIIILP